MKKEVLRTCIITGEKLSKKDLIRIVRCPNGEVIIDDSYKANGRGAYLKNEIEVIKKAMKNKALNRHLKVDVPSEIYEKLIK